MVFKIDARVGAGNKAVMKTPGNRPEDRSPGTHRNESPAGYSWRVALQQSPLPLLLPGPFWKKGVFGTKHKAANGEVSPVAVSQKLTRRTAGLRKQSGV